MELIYSKLSPDIQSRWGKKLSKSNNCLNLQDFADWLHSVVKGEMMVKHCQIKIGGEQQAKQKQEQTRMVFRLIFRFLWRKSGSTEPPKMYQMTVHIFGAVSSPTSCMFALRRTEEDFGHLYPHVVDNVLNNI